MTAKQSLKNYIAYLIGKNQSIGLLEAVKADVPRTDGIAGTREFEITELYRDGRGVCHISDGINRRSVHELTESQCKHILVNL